MNIEVHRAEYQEVEALRELYRQEVNCQIIHDSILRRGMADPYLILVNGRIAGYGGVWNKHDIGRLMEYYTLPSARAYSLPMFQELLKVSQAVSMEVQTNIPLMLQMFVDCASNIRKEYILFEDAKTTDIGCADGIFRRIDAKDKESLFEHKHEPGGEWMIEARGEAVATGGALYHYNPPYGDIYMEVEESHRRRGYGSYLVQELKRVCYEIGKKPAARCNVHNTASRATLQKAGLLPCGSLLVGDIIASEGLEPV